MYGWLFGPKHVTLSWRCADLDGCDAGNPHDITGAVDHVRRTGHEVTMSEEQSWPVLPQRERQEEQVTGRG